MDWYHPHPCLSSPFDLLLGIQPSSLSWIHPLAAHKEHSDDFCTYLTRPIAHSRQIFWKIRWRIFLTWYYHSVVYKLIAREDSCNIQLILSWMNFSSSPTCYYIGLFCFSCDVFWCGLYSSKSASEAFPWFTLELTSKLNPVILTSPLLYPLSQLFFFTLNSHCEAYTEKFGIFSLHASLGKKVIMHWVGWCKTQWLPFSSAQSSTVPALVHKSKNMRTPWSLFWSNDHDDWHNEL